MFELKIALKYLLPKRKALSTSLISLMSVFVISLVVWLVLVFLSVTSGIEKNWLSKLTSLNAPLRISPTDHYYSSYYYQIDSLSSSSSFSYQTIREKAYSENTDPYSPEEDMQLPHFMPPIDISKNGQMINPVKDLYHILDNCKKEIPSFVFQDYEISGALMRLTLNRNNRSLFESEKASVLSQMSYLISNPEKNPHLSHLILPPDITDLNNFLNQMEKSYHSSQKDASTWGLSKEKSSYAQKLQSFFQNIDVKKIELDPHFSLSIDQLPLGRYEVFVDANQIVFKKSGDSFKKATLVKQATSTSLLTSHQKISLGKEVRILMGMPTVLSAKLEQESLENAYSLNDIHFLVNFDIIDTPFDTIVSYQHLKLFEATPQISFTQTPKHLPPWAYTQDNCYFLPEKSSVLLPKTYKDSKVLAGDYGYLAYTAPGAFSTQEMRYPFYVAGFYDPGIMPTGNKCLFVNHNVTRMINASSQIFSSDSTPVNGIFVWFDSIKSAQAMKNKLEASLETANLLPYWKIETFEDYDFSKELMQQFHSDRILFSLIAMIIIIVACSNIISLLVILVNDKKREIAILSSMGASNKSISAIFGICGVSMGLLSSFLGIMAALITLKHLNSVVSFLSYIQGHDAFQTAFFGNSLPNELSFEALIFILIVTPLISLLAGLIPAIKASKTNPSSILRSE